jgi:hypothetical protein
MNAEETMRNVRTLVAEYRDQCLWFLRPDYFPATTTEALQALDYIQRHGDRNAFRKAARLKQWLSQSSNAPSVAS